MVDFSLEAAKQ